MDQFPSLITLICDWKYFLTPVMDVFIFQKLIDGANKKVVIHDHPCHK